MQSHIGERDPNPKGVRYPKCEKELSAWFDWCMNGNRIDTTARLQCEQRLTDEIDRPIEEAEERAHPSPPPAQDPKMEAALHDLQHNLPLPGMPNLKKAVFLKKGSVACVSPGALGNPHRELTVAAKACVVLAQKTKVLVIMPNDAQTYLMEHYSEMTNVTWRSSNISDGTVYSGWVSIADLQN